MRGRPGCPTGQKKYSVGATAGSPLFYFYKGRLGTKSPPHPTRLCRPTFPPRGRLWVEKNLASQTSGPRKGRNKIQFVFCTDMCRAKNSSHPESASFAGAVRGASPNFGIPAQRVPKFLPLPARPAGGRAVTGVRYRAAGQAKKEGGPPQGPPKPEKVGPGRKNLFLPGVLSSGFLQRKPGSPAGVGGGNHVAGPTLRRSRRPQTWPPPGRRPTGRCAPRPVKAPPTWRVPIISPVAFLSRAPQNTARPPPAGRPPGRSTPRPPRLGGSSRPSPARGRRR